ncbi:MAG: lipid II flippase MurJ [Candidatus Endonucleobacter sp. (ex Gigantidas childressi)]|nr:lipid II flippase MurJ [Candidatus Endonucleobacter sp. (ex Gigantidas childressi)]
MSKIIIINSLILSMGILIGRLSGYIREIVIASKYGATEQSDNILLILTIPDLLNNLLASGAIVGMLIPLLNTHVDNIEEVLTEFTKKLFYITLMFYIVVVIIIFFMYDFYLFGLLAISLLSVFPNIYTFIITGYLQFEKKFKKQSLNTLVFNITIIIFLLFEVQYFIFSVGVIIASLIRLIWIYSDLGDTNISYRSVLKQVQSSTLKYKTIIFMMLANGLMFINPMIDKLFAAYFQEGSVAILSYAEKIYLLPVSVFLTTYAVAMFPDLSKLVANGKKRDITTFLQQSLSLNLFISCIIGGVLYIFSEEVVSLLFGVANLNKHVIDSISVVLDGYIITLVMAGTNSILLNLIFSYKWYENLIFYSVFMVVSKVILNTLTVKCSLDIKYIAYGTSLISVLSTTYLSLLYIRKVNKK